MLPISPSLPCSDIQAKKALYNKSINLLLLKQIGYIKQTYGVLKYCLYMCVLHVCFVLQCLSFIVYGLAVFSSVLLRAFLKFCSGLLCALMLLFEAYPYFGY